MKRSNYEGDEAKSYNMESKDMYTKEELIEFINSL